jgi:hypothetical protein
MFLCCSNTFEQLMARDRKLEEQLQALKQNHTKTKRERRLKAAASMLKEQVTGKAAAWKVSEGPGEGRARAIGQLRGR